MDEVMRGEATPAQIGGLLVGLRAKGETVDEITGFAEAMREHVVPVRPTRSPLVDVVGTGGDGARHVQHLHRRGDRRGRGRRRASPSTATARRARPCGSADVLEALGLVARASRRSGSPRRSTSSASASCSPARITPRCATRRPSGRSSARARCSTSSARSRTPPARATASSASTRPALARTYAESLAGLGARRAFVVHGDGARRALPVGAEPRRRGASTATSREWELDPRTLGLVPGRPGGAARRRRRRRTRPPSARVLAGERGVRRDAVAPERRRRRSSPPGSPRTSRDGIGLARGGDRLRRRGRDARAAGRVLEEVPA